MSENHIKLKFDPTVSRLAGFPFGEEVYKKQVCGQVDFSKQVVIEFPQQIIKVASSFVQGFFKGIVEQVGMEAVGKEVQIVTANPALIDSILDNLI